MSRTSQYGGSERSQTSDSFYQPVITESGSMLANWNHSLAPESSKLRRRDWLSVALPRGECQKLSVTIGLTSHCYGTYTPDPGPEDHTWG